MKKYFCAAMVLAALSPVSANALDNHGDWVVENKDGRCIAWTSPQSTQSDAGVNRYASIVNAPSEGVRNSVALVYGQEGAGKMHASANVDGKSFDLLTFETAAFAASGSPEAELISAMKGGAELEVKWTSADGVTSVDNYSLIGFTAAKRQIDSDCH